jgi:hypothetical protein
MSVDPVLGNTSNPQRMNRYAYVLNDPVNFWDPDGRQGRSVQLKRNKRGPGWIPDRDDVAAEEKTRTRAPSQPGNPPWLGGGGEPIPETQSDGNRAGGSLTSDETLAFVSAIPGARKNAITAAGKGPCATFLTKVIGALADLKGLEGKDRASFTVDTLLNAVRDAYFFPSWLGSAKVQRSFTDEYTLAAVFQSDPSNIYFRDQSSLGIAHLVLHEAFHASTWVESAGRVGGFFASDLDLGRALVSLELATSDQVSTVNDASAAFSDAISARCQ